MTSHKSHPTQFLPDSGRPAVAGRISGSPITGEAHSLVNPATEMELAVVGWATTNDVSTAVESAAAAQAAWATTSGRDRASALRNCAEALRNNADSLAPLITAESGKPLKEAQGEVAFSARYFEWFAEAIATQRGELFTTEERRFLVNRKPVGVVVAASPWNFPLSIPVRKIAAALAAGCPVIQKASELTPLSSLALTELCEPHLPSGVIGILVGDGETLTTGLVDHPLVRSITFTGSTTVGKKVAERAMRTMTRVTMELGGQAPFIVCEDADLDVALDALMLAKFRNNGASCLAANNVFIHESHYDELVSRLWERMSDLTVGDPSVESTQVGPLINSQQVKRLNGLVADAEAAGSTVSRTSHTNERGWFLPPTLVECEKDVDLWSQEIFGPVCAVRRFSDESQVIQQANAFGAGLGAYVISRNFEHQVRLASALNVGIVGINNGAPNSPEIPFGGIGDSGIGREGGVSGMLEFLEEQTLSIAR